MHIVTLLLVALSLPSAGVAHDNPAPRTQAALGLSVLDRGISLWLIRPKTILGLELDRLELTWDDLIYSSSVKTVNHRTSRIRLALTAKRIVSEGTVSKFAYLRSMQRTRTTNGKKALISIGGLMAPRSAWVPYGDP